ncbi:MAG: cupredoxin domain-containing protein [Ilyomonas sp.]
MKTRSILLSLMCTLLLFFVFNGCSKSNDNGYGNNNNNNNNGGSGNAVSIKGFAFSVSTLNVAEGTKVTWTNNDATTHTVTADDDSFNSGDIAAGQTYSRTFSVAGTYNYHCVYHSMMKGSVVVKP